MRVCACAACVCACVCHRARATRKTTPTQQKHAPNQHTHTAPPQIITNSSGFGRTAAFRSLRSNSIYTLETAGWGGQVSVRCGPEDFTPVAAAARDFSLI